MVGTENLSELEKRVFEDRATDGLFEMVVGVMFLAFAVLLYFDQSSFIGVIAAFPVIFLKQLRAKIVEPRLGTVTPTGDRARHMGSRRQTLIYTLLALILLGVVVFLLVRHSDIPESTHRTLKKFSIDMFALMILVVFLMVGRVNGYRHLLAYLMMGIGILLVRALLRLPEITGFLMIGLVLSVVGVRSLVRFTSRYPVIPAEDA